MSIEAIGILDDSDHLHVRSALGTCHRIDLVDLREKSSTRPALDPQPRACLATIPSYGKHTIRSGESAVVVSAECAG